MKNNLLVRIFLSLVIVCGAVSTIRAQDKPQATMVEEYTTNQDVSVFEAAAERFIFVLKQQPETTVGVVGITERGVLGEKFKTILLRHPGLKNHIIYYFGKGIRNSRFPFSSDFWIVPAGAEMPNLGDFDPPCVCPTLTVEDNSPSDISAPRIFKTAARSPDEDDEITYQWKVSAGEIVEGQNTPVIRVDAKGAKEVTATLEIGGVCDECPREASFTSKISDELKLTDVIGSETECAAGAKLDVFLLSLANNPAAKGYIITYGGRAKTLADIRRREHFITTYLMFRQVDTSRIAYIDGGNREHVASELWLAPDDIQKPVATPTVDAKYVDVPAAAKKSGRRRSK